jgi:hypothetical protein
MRENAREEAQAKRVSLGSWGKGLVRKRKLIRLVWKRNLRVDEETYELYEQTAGRTQAGLIV